MAASRDSVAVPAPRLQAPSYMKMENVIAGQVTKFINVGAFPRFNPKHKWFYYPEQTNEEVLVFRHMTPKDPKLACFHGACGPRPLPKGAESRMSIEGRGFCFFKKGTVYKKHA
jgi:hypothetical protein